ncbi:unnamed protein product [Rhizophagus irregularis]|nr:unnamed protein product [Rhizophagus irregularis]
MSSITTRSKARTNEKRTLEDSEIVKEVYSIDKDSSNSQLKDDSNRPNKIRTIDTSNNTDAMEVEFEKNSYSRFYIT